jgi:hypothetical protein
MPTSPLNTELIALVNRIDERTELMQKTVDDLKESVDKHYDEVYATMDKHYTKKAEFEPIRKIVFGFVCFLLLSIGGMFVSVVVKSNTLPAEVSTIHQPGPVHPIFPPAQKLSND